jgi:hypothetical protein
MKNRIFSFGLAIALAAPLATGTSQAWAQSPGAVARDNCEYAVSDRLRSNSNVSGRVQYLGSPKLRQVSNAETGVSGTGQFEARGGWSKFSYHCTYNIRNGRTSNISVKLASGRPGSSGRGDNVGKAIGAIIGTAIAGAIVNAVDHKGHSNRQSQDDGWWSPGGNVSCNSYQSICQEQGRFSPYWTHRIYGG